MTYTTEDEVRDAFWEAHPAMEAEAQRRGTIDKGQNAQLTDTRCAFVDFVDMLARDGHISEALAQRVTL